MIPRIRRRSSQSRRPYLEALETRALLSASLDITGTSPDFFRGNSGVYDNSGNLWIANNSVIGGEIDRVSFDSSGNPVLNPDISVPDTAPRSLVQTGGKFYFIDDNTGDIDQVDPAHPSTPAVVFAINATFNGDNSVPNQLAASADGAIWWVAGAFDSPPDATGVSHRDNVVGRLDPGSSATNFFMLNNSNTSAGESQNIAISPYSTNGVYIGLAGVSQTNTITNTPIQGHSHIATATFSAGSISATVYTLASTNPDDVTANQNNYLTGVATAADGSVWFSLANSPSTPLRPGQVADRLVHGTIAGATVNETSYVIPGATTSNPLNTGPIAMDGSARLWFVNMATADVGFLDTTNLADTANRFTIDALPDGPGGATTDPDSIFTDSHAGGHTAWVTTESDGYTLLKVDVVAATADTPLNITNSSFNSLVLRIALVTVTFTDDVGSTASEFTATINWGDGHTSTGAILTDPTTGGRYLAVALHQYAKRGTYHISVTMTTTEVGGVLGNNVATGTVTVR